MYFIRNKGFDSQFHCELFGRFTAFTNEDGELEVVDNTKFLVLRDRRTGRRHSQNLDEFVELIKIVFPERKEQLSLLKQMFNNPEDELDEELLWENY